MVFSPRRFWKSFQAARHGLTRAMASEHSFRIHALVAVVIVALILFLRLPRAEAALLILLVSTILTLELVNTVVERFVDMLEPRVHPYVGVIKDLMAAAVLITSIASVIIGLVIFLPYLRPL
jgi:undecaprenol kinase